MSPNQQQSQWSELDEAVVRTARGITLDAVNAAGHGHPGTALALAPVMQVLYGHILQYDPTEPAWPGRDRFILSIGHASLLQYIQLYLTGSGLELSDVKRYRKHGSLTPGHPEYGHTSGVETTTGPLGQGFANAVGMAMAARRERQLFDPETAASDSPFEHTIWVLAGDGDMQEGVSMEAASLAGTLQLSNLVVIYDDNNITIDGPADLSFGDDVGARHRAMGWTVVDVQLGDDGDIAAADLLDVCARHRELANGKPLLIILKSQIAWPAPNAMNTSASHGSPLSSDEIALTKAALGLDASRTFQIGSEVQDYRETLQTRLGQARKRWDDAIEQWATRTPDRAALRERLLSGELPSDWHAALPVFDAGEKIATRAASQQAITALASVLPEIWGGGADLTQSTGVMVPGKVFHPEHGSPSDEARAVYWGVREHAMAAALNGIVLHGPTIPIGATYLVFSDYMRPAVRLAAMMSIPSVFVWSHDSIGVGADGPTHQPIEHLASLRLIPGFSLIRPADANETVATWRHLVSQPHGAVGLALARHGTEVFALPGSEHPPIERGGYTLIDSGEPPQVVLVATGSEVEIAAAAARELAGEIPVRVVSMPCREWFLDQPREYREEVLPCGVPIVVVEAASPVGWAELSADVTSVVGTTIFGASADPDELYRDFGLTTEHVVSTVHDCLPVALTP